jgi:L-lactate permease
VRPWITYSLVRFLLFAGVLALLLVLNVNPFLAAIIAAVIGFAASYLFLRGMRERVATDLAARRGTTEKPAKPTQDDDEEDRALDA